jgi:hypothetical protein
MSTSPREVSEEVLKLVSHCPVCERSSHGVDVRVLEAEGDAFRLHVTCRKCRCAVVSLIVSAPPSLTAVSVMTDLSYEDVGRFIRSTPVSVNDVIETHAWLEGNGWRSLMAPTGNPRRTLAPARPRGRRIDK